jgi:DNA-binding HxlR family transcriptional regulator
MKKTPLHPKSFEVNGRFFYCPVELTFSIIGGKYKGILLWLLRDGCLRYGELRKLLKGITHKMLTQSLRELEQDGLVHREVYPEVPPRVEYSLTQRGQEILPVLKEMAVWGLKFENDGKDVAA